MPVVKEGIGNVVSGHVIKACRGSRGIAPHIINHRTRWKLLIRFTPPPLYLRKRKKKRTLGQTRAIV
jgi:hypothetical protein